MIALLIGFMLAVVGDGAANEIVYRFNFQESQFDEQALRLVGSENAVAWESIHRQPQGLRMQLFSDSEVSMVGVANRFAIRGDFEITASYEIVNCDLPQLGYGAGPGIYIKALSSDENTALLAHLERVDEGNVLSAYFATNRPDGSRWHQPSFTKTDLTSGVLRMTRIGNTLRYYIAEPDSKDFRLLREASFGLHDLAIVRLGVDKGGSQSNLEVLWKDLTIRLHAPKRTLPWQPIGWGLAIVFLSVMTFLVSRRLYSAKARLA